jgi:hypothetical protein
MSSCFFTGPMPDTLFENTNLTRVYLDNNALNGTIPSNYANPPGLQELFINNNMLTGTIPAVTETQFASLLEFTLQYNDLTGSMPNGICQLRESGVLGSLFSDCGGQSPEIQCDFPDCCNRCFQGQAPTQ